MINARFIRPTRGLLGDHLTQIIIELAVIAQLIGNGLDLSFRLNRERQNVFGADDDLPDLLSGKIIEHVIIGQLLSPPRSGECGDHRHNQKDCYRVKEQLTKNVSFFH